MPEFNDITDTNSFNHKSKISLISTYFFQSQQKWIAWLLLIGIIICTIALVGIVVAFSWWNAAFWGILISKSFGPFLISIGQFAGLLSAYVGFNVLKNNLIGKLTIRWRDWLISSTLNQFFGDNEDCPYLQLIRTHPEIDGIGQRIQEDSLKFVKTTLNLGVELLHSILSLASFGGTLWIIGGSLAFVALGLNIVIPGYLFWTALLVSIIATIITHFIGRSLVIKNQLEESTESEFRETFTEVIEQTEEIGLQNAASYFKKILNTIREKILDISNQKLNTETQLVAFNNFYTRLSTIIPDLLATPLYFAGLIDIGQLMQTSMAFEQVNSALSCFVTFYEKITKWRASRDRLNELLISFQHKGLNISPQNITLSPGPGIDKTILIKGLTLFYPHALSSPSNTEAPLPAPTAMAEEKEPVQETTQHAMMRGLELQLKEKQHTFIKAQFGLGKSTLFKAICGTWKFGEGTISIPEGESTYFLPQKPILPNNTTLKQLLAFPDPENTYTDEEYKTVLGFVRLKKLEALLDTKKRTWKILSGGEQQMIGFARVFLKKPKRLFLDESTSSLDEKSQEYIYKKTKCLLRETTLVSIAHRKTVRQFHDRIISLKADKDKKIIVKEKNPMPLNQN